MQYIEPRLQKYVAAPNNKLNQIAVEAWGRNKDHTKDGLSMRVFSEARWKGSYLHEFLLAHAKEHGITTYYSPLPTEMNGEICYSADLSEGYRLDSGTTLMLRGKKADACRMPCVEDTAWIVSPADCLTGTGISDTGDMICVHAARDSLFSRNLKEDSTGEEVINGSVMRHLIKLAEEVPTTIWTGLSVDPLVQTYNINDIKYGLRNRTIRNAMIKIGLPTHLDDGETFSIDLLQVAYSQFVQGSRHDKPRGSFYSDETRTNIVDWYSHANGDSGRNLVIVRCL